MLFLDFPIPNYTQGGLSNSAQSRNNGTQLRVPDVATSVTRVKKI